MGTDSAYIQKEYEDFLSEFSGGMNSGVSPLLLAKNQYAFGQNCSIRNGYIHTRPPFSKKNFNFNGNTALQTLVLGGRFQGGGYYRPDVGTESLVAQISGHLIMFTESGAAWLVTDISVPGSLNSATQPQVWMWQAENYLIVQDGSGALPIFYDGKTSRRSFGPSMLLGTVSGVPAPTAPPAIGQSVTVTLTSPYTGLLNIPVIFNSEFYQASPAAGNQIILTNQTATPGTVIPAGMNIVSSGVSGTNATNYSNVVNAPASPASVLMTLSVSSALGISAGDSINFPNLNTTVFVPGSGQNSPPVSGRTVQVTDVNLQTKVIKVLVTVTFSPVPPGNQLSVTLNAGSAFTTTPAGGTIVYGQTTAPFTVPSVGATVTVTINRAYTGGANSAASINGFNYTIQPNSQASGGTTLVLTNLSDTSTLNYPAGLTVRSVPEIPAGRMGQYGMGCNCCSLVDGVSYIIGDVVGAGSGTIATNYRDAVLKVTQNDFLFGGGSFRIPGTGEIISSVHFPPQLDTSLGQGPLEIGTQFSFFSNIVPGTNPATWPTLTSPIQTQSLKDKGPLSHWSTVMINSDTFFRSTDGISTLVMARRSFQGWGNKPSSNEMQRPLNDDDQSLLPYSSAVSFDNRLIHTTNPHLLNATTLHSGFVTLNFDLTSSLRQTLPPSWEALWTGLNVLQAVSGRINGSNRSFAFSFNKTTSQIELYELLPENSTSYQDNDITPITWAFETPVIFGRDVKHYSEFIQLRDAEIYVSDIIGPVTIKVYWRPDFYPCWTLWNTVNLCQSSDAANSKAGYRMRVGLGQPASTAFEAGNNRPLRMGYFFQLRVVITGSCTWKGMRVAAISAPQPSFAPINPVNKSCQIIDCDMPDDFALYQLQG